MTSLPQTGAALINWNLIETVLLDMDGTLLDLHFDNHFWLVYLPIKYAEQRQIALEEAKTVLFQRFAAEKGTLNWYCLDFWSEQLQTDIVKLKEEVSHLIDIRPNVVPFLNGLSSAGKKCYLVTNAHQKSLDLKLQKTGIDKHLDAIYCSHDFNAPKESQAFWIRFQRHLGFDKMTTLLVDDSLDVLKSAKTFGIRYLLSIEQPDSKVLATNTGGRDTGEFDAIACYSHIMPLPHSDKA